MVCVAHDYIIGRFPEECQREVYEGDADNLIAGSLAPQGVIDRVEGGWRLTGRWQFGSGCDHSPWFILGTKVANPGPDDYIIHHVMVPRADVVLDDTWHTLGMRGTGSKDLVVTDAFIPGASRGADNPDLPWSQPACEGADVPAFGLLRPAGHAVRLRPRHGRSRLEGFRRSDIHAHNAVWRRQGQESHHAKACGGIVRGNRRGATAARATCAIASMP